MSTSSGTPDDALARGFEAESSAPAGDRLPIARLTAEAEDVVQDAWLRPTAPTHKVDNLGGWLTTIVARLCLDRLRTRAARREDSLEFACRPGRLGPDGSTPEHEAILADSVGLAMLIVLETLTPAERLAFVLHDTLGLPFEQIGRILERTPAARQLASRARRRVRGAAPAEAVPPARQRELVEAFLRAAREDELNGLVRVLDPKAIARAESDEAHRCSVRPRSTGPRGRPQAAAFRRLAPGARHVLVNGSPGFFVTSAGRPFAVLGITSGRGHHRDRHPARPRPTRQARATLLIQGRRR